MAAMVGTFAATLFWVAFITVIAIESLDQTKENRDDR